MFQDSQFQFAVDLKVVSHALLQLSPVELKIFFPKCTKKYAIPV